MSLNVNQYLRLLQRLTEVCGLLWVLAPQPVRLAAPPRPLHEDVVDQLVPELVRGQVVHQDLCGPAPDGGRLALVELPGAVCGGGQQQVGDRLLRRLPRLAVLALQQPAFHFKVKT